MTFRQGNWSTLWAGLLQGLLHKMSHYGITGRTNTWIKSFLRDQQQAVMVDGTRLNFVSWESEVPYGSVLVPELFVLYISDLPQQPISRLRLFEDDTICQCPISTAEDQAILQNDLNNFCMGNEKADVTCASTRTDATS